MEVSGKHHNPATFLAVENHRHQLNRRSHESHFYRNDMSEVSIAVLPSSSLEAVVAVLFMSCLSCLGFPLGSLKTLMIPSVSPAKTS
jgi:hypothetical protein